MRLYRMGGVRTENARNSTIHTMCTLPATTANLCGPLAFSLPAPCLSYNLPSLNRKLFTNPNSITKLVSSNSSLLQSSMASTTLQVKYSSVSTKESDATTSSGEIVGQHDLLIIGPGVLGRLVAQQWRQVYPGCQIVGQTVTTDHHDELIQMGINPSLKETKPTQQFPYVIFCAPPSRSPDYAQDLKEAASNWSSGGAFLFTSSSALFDCDDNGFCDEDSPVVPLGKSPRTDVLLNAEKVVLDCGGSVVRLAGLYKADRGAHNYWLKKGIVDARPDHILNLIHYEDAASLAVAILKKKLRGRIFLGCDNHPVSRQEVMDLVNRSEKFSDKFEAFTGTSGSLGKRLSNTKTREEIGWEPVYPSFAEFLETLK